jgi:hypothetical protein
MARLAVGRATPNDITLGKANGASLVRLQKSDGVRPFLQEQSEAGDDVSA